MFFESMSSLNAFFDTEICKLHRTESEIGLFISRFESPIWSHSLLDSVKKQNIQIRSLLDNILKDLCLDYSDCDIESFHDYHGSQYLFKSCSCAPASFTDFLEIIQSAEHYNFSAYCTLRNLSVRLGLNQATDTFKTILRMKREISRSFESLGLATMIE
jgi:hypothetical protein